MSSLDHGMAVDANILPKISPRQAIRQARSKLAERETPRSGSLFGALFLATVLALVIWGWLHREEEMFTAKEGVGYALGIAGGVGLLMQFLYPLRKHLGFARRWGSVKHWFRIHKMLGLVAPLLILYHANFRLHAVNSNVALFSMLIVVASGLVGRFIYMKIHSSHYGELMSLKELQGAFGLSRQEMDHDKFITRRVKTRLHAFEDYALAPASSPLQGLWRLLSLGHRTRRARAAALSELRRGLSDMARRKNWDEKTLQLRLRHDRELIHAHLMSVSRIVEFSAYRRLFSLWHSLHMPLFFMLLVTGIVHVIAVHMY